MEQTLFQRLKNGVWVDVKIQHICEGDIYRTGPTGDALRAVGNARLQAGPGSGWSVMGEPANLDQQ